LLLAATPGADEPTLIRVGGGVLEVHIDPDGIGVTRPKLLAWVESCAQAVAGYFGRFPVSHVQLNLMAGRRGKIGSGRTWGGQTPRMRVAVGPAATEADLADDWVLTHEMVHLGFPNMPDGFGWMEEGLATYVEPIARARLGQLSDARVWGDLVDGLPRGLPSAGDGGLDGTHSWGRTYWGGALFWLLADIEIRERSHGRAGLEDALRGVLAAGGSIEVDWKPSRVFAEGDRAVGVRALEPLHERFGSSPQRVDLAALWKRLGVRQGKEGATFDDHAPLAALRRSITAAPSATSH
jgi:hypothetical protein